MNHSIFHIVAASGDAFSGKGVIGVNNQLPWHDSNDLKFFKATTMGSTLIMGRKTYESIGKPLPGRENIVLSRSKPNVPGEVKVYHSIKDAITNSSKEKIFVIGGGQLFAETINEVNGIFLTKIPGSYEGDTFYPPIPKTFEENSKISQDLKNQFQIDVVYLENTKKAGH